MAPQEPQAAEDGAPAAEPQTELGMGGRLARDWVPCQNYGTASFIPPGASLHVVLVAPRDVSIPTVASPAPTEVGVVETETEVATTRVVGQVFIAVSDDVIWEQTNLQVAERVRVGIYDNAGAFAFFANSLYSAQDANEPFLWQRYSTPSQFGNMEAQVSHPWWSVVDIRVGRRLRQDQALFYSVSNPQPAGGQTIVVKPLLRTLARLA